MIDCARQSCGRCRSVRRPTPAPGAIGLRPARRLTGTRRAALAAAAVAALALGAGCGWLAAPRPLVVSFGEEPVAIDPHRGNRNVAWSVLSSICDPLVGFAPDLTLEPALAESWEHPDATHWRFTLRRGVRFHNGAALTAADVVASIERARTHPTSAVSYYLVGVENVLADGDRTVAIETSAPIPDLLNRLTFVLVVPREQAAEKLIAAPVGTGSYRFVRKEPDGAIVVKAWAGWRGRPEVADVRFEFCDSDEEAARRLVAGATDVCHHVPDDWINDLGAAAYLRLIQQPRLAVQVLGIHPELATGEAMRALADRRVRRALLLALDRPSWVRRIFRGNGAVATQFVHPAVLGFDPELGAPPYDPEAARQLLAEAGFAGGFDVVLSPGKAGAELQAAITDDLGHVGVRVRSDPSSSTGPLTYFAWACSTGDASDFLNTTLWRDHPAAPSRPDARAVHKEIAALAAAADRETDPVRRLALLQGAQRLLLDEMPLLPLMVRWGYKGVSSRVEVVTRYDERESVAAYRWRR